MSPSLAPLLAGFALSLALIVAIGAQNLFVLRQGLRGEHVGPIVLFCGICDAALILIGVAGVGAALAAIPQLTVIMTLGGALFLFAYGLIALRRTLRPGALVADPSVGGKSLRTALLATAGFTFLNPHVYLDTMLLMGTAGAAQPAATRPLFVAGAVAASFLWFAALGYGARLLQPLFARPAAWRALDAGVGVTMLTLSALLVRSAL
ncbi:LysE/ArgO family amino acid transporter [Aureimonas mangrovi]|uniref:LysE/ArgO family amino acid transporter n=1 Tax=Aureimonas mangrovi TaxID=2758041 RepID=UPI00163DB58F|nr:LysE family transporter [Aureimonas mangrovi]